jgi:hypothetical protein
VAFISFARDEHGKFREYQETDAISFQEAQSPSDFQHRTDWITGVANSGPDGAGWLHATFHGTPGGPGQNATIHDDTSRYPVEWASRQGYCGTQFTDDPIPVRADGMLMGGVTGRYAVHRIFGTNNALVNPQRTEQSGDPDDDARTQVEYILIDQWDALTLTEDVANVADAGPEGRTILSKDALAARITDDAETTVLPNGFTIEEWFDAGSEPSPFRTGRGSIGSLAPEKWQSQTDSLNTNNKVWVEDVTIPVYMAKEIVRRFRQGAGVLEVRTSLSQVDVDLGDFVSLIGDDMVVSYLRGDGADTNVLWEVTSKEIKIHGDQGGVIFELTFVRDDRDFIADVSYERVLPVLEQEVPGIPAVPVVEDKRLFLRDTDNPAVRHEALALDGQELQHLC